MEVALISEALFKENSPIKDDTIIAKFVPYIGIAQRMYLDKLLGRALVEELQAQIKAAQVEPTPDPYPITEHNQALLQLIAAPLSFYAVYQGIPFHWAAIINKGITVRESENSKAVDIKDIAQLRRWLKDDAEFLIGQLVEYLCECGENYPLWKSGDYCGKGCDGSTTNNLPFDAGIYIPTR